MVIRIIRLALPILVAFSSAAAPAILGMSGNTPWD